MTATTIDAKDSRPMRGVAKAAATTPTQKGTLTADMFAYSAATAQGKTKDEIVEAVIKLRVARERATSGRSLSEPVNVLEEVVSPLLGVAEDVTPALLTAAGAAGGTGGGPAGTVVGGVAGKAAGEIAQDMVQAANGALKYVLTFPSVADYVKGVRARSGAEATAEYAKDAGLLDDAVEAAWSAAKKDAESAEAFRVLFPDLAGTPDDQQFTATAGEVVDNHPELFDVTYVTVQADNSVVIREIDEARSDVLARLEEFSADVDGRLAEVSDGLTDMQRRQDVHAEGLAGLRRLIEKAQAGAQKRAEDEQAARDQAAFVKKLYDDAQGTINGIAALATLIGDPKLGSDIAKFGGAVIQTVVATSKLVSAVGDVIGKGLGAITALGMAAATGNVLGAIAGLVSIFAPSGPTPEQQILEGVQRIEESIAKLHKAVESGFKRIDEKLDKIYLDLSDRLGDLARKADLTLEDLLDIRRRVARDRDALAGTAISLAAYFAAAERRTLFETIHAALEYSDRNAEDMTQAEFNSSLSSFYTWATQTCFDQANQPLAGRSTSLEDLAGPLRAGDRADHASFVNRALADNGLEQFLAEDEQSARAPLPNTAVWFIAARAYLQLQSEWPALTDATDDRRPVIVAVGRSCRQALAARATDRAFCDALVDKYLEVAMAFGRSVDGLRARFEVDEIPIRLGHTAGKGRAVRCDILGPADVRIDYDWPVPGVMRSDFGGPDLPVPAGVEKFLPPATAMAAWLGAPVELRYDIGTSPVTIEKVIRGAGRPVRQELQGTRIHVTAYATVAGRRIEADFGVPAHDTLGGNRPREVGVQVWPAIRQKWAAVVAQTPPSSVPADPVVADVITAGLRDLRRQFRDHVVEQSGPGGRLDTTCNELDGAAALVEAVTALVAPVPRTDDDILRAFFDGPPLDVGGIALFAPSAPLALARMMPVHDVAGGAAGVGYGSWILDAVSAPAGFFRERMAAWAQAAADGSAPPTYPDVDETLLRLESADRLFGLLDATHKLATSAPPTG